MATKNHHTWGIRKGAFPWPDMDIRMAHSLCGTPTRTSKMPGLSWSLPAKYCNVGSTLRATNPDSVCAECYALKGRYLMPNVALAQEDRWEKLACALRTTVYRDMYIIGMCRIIWNQKHFRWFDSGDIKNWEHLTIILDVCRRTPHVSHWLPTKEYQLIYMLKNSDHYNNMPDNLNIRVSGAMIDDIKVSFWDGFTASAVTTDHEQVTCPAYDQGGHCDGVNVSCRKCWDKNEPIVIYPKH